MSVSIFVLVLVLIFCLGTGTLGGIMYRYLQGVLPGTVTTFWGAVVLIAVSMSVILLAIL